MPQRIPEGGRLGVGLGLRRGPSSVRRLFSKATSQHSEPPSQANDAATATSPVPAPAMFEQLEDRVLLSTYYVSTSGADSRG